MSAISLTLRHITPFHMIRTQVSEVFEWIGVVEPYSVTRRMAKVRDFTQCHIEFQITIWVQSYKRPIQYINALGYL